MKCDFPQAVLAVTLLSASAAAQSPQLIVSTTADPGVVDPVLPAFEDSDLIRLEAGSAPRPWLMTGSWRALLGDVASDIDALALRPGFDPHHARAVVFSTLSNFAGFDDGDLLALDAFGVIEVLVDEDDLTLGLGVSGAAIDVDGAAFDDEGRLLFSLQSDLGGTLLGDLSNGDVLRLELDGLVSRVATEAEVDAALAAATSLSSSVGDVHGVDWRAGELWVAIQSPGEHDGGVLAVGANARIVADESTLGLGGEELDAIASLAPDTGELFTLWIDGSGATRRAVVEGGSPSGVGLAMATPQTVYLDAFPLQGIGAWSVDVFDPLLGAQLPTGAACFGFDGSGRFEATIGVPVAGAGADESGALGWTYQVLDLTTLTLSPGFRIDV